MTVGGSQQQRLYRRARRDGATMITAAVQAGISIGEAKLIEAEDLKNPPPSEAFELLNTAPASGATTENDDMGRPKKQPEAVQEGGAPDFALAVKIYRNDIKPAQSKVGEYAQEQAEAYKAIKRQGNIQPQAAKLAFKMDGMEESKRDDFLRSFNGLLRELNIFMPVDLVDAAEGKGSAGESVVPTGSRPRPRLATVPAGPAKDGTREGDVFDAALSDAAE